MATDVTIVEPQELWPAGQPVGDTVDADQISWSVLQLSLDTGRLEYCRSGAASQSQTQWVAELPTVTAAVAEQIMAKVEDDAQRVLDVYNREDATAVLVHEAGDAFNRAVVAASVELPPACRVRGVEAGQWWSMRYGGIGEALAALGTVSADSTDAALQRVVDSEHEMARKSLYCAQVIIVGLWPVLAAARGSYREQLHSEARAIAEQVSVLERQRDQMVRRLYALGYTNRRIGELVGLTHPTVATRVASPRGMIDRVRAWVDEGSWVGGPAGGKIMHRDGMMLVLPVDSPEVLAVMDHGGEPIRTGVFVHTQQRPVRESTLDFSKLIDWVLAFVGGHGKPVRRSEIVAGAYAAGMHACARGVGEVLQVLTVQGKIAKVGWEIYQTVADEPAAAGVSE